MPAKKAAKKAPTRPAKQRKSHTISVRVDDEMHRWLEKHSSGEAYGTMIRKMVREEMERERNQGG